MSTPRYDNWRKDPYFSILEPDVWSRAKACRDKGMGAAGFTWEDIANHLWEFYLGSRSSWPGENHAPPSKELFYSWVQGAVAEYDKAWQ